MKKLIISGFLLLNVLSFTYAQETVTPTSTAAPVTSTPPPAPAATVTPAPVSAPDAKADNDDPSLKFGFKITPTYCWLKLDRTGYSSDGGYVGYTYGIMTDFRVATNYYIATGVEISQRGGKYKSDQLNVNENVFAKGKVTQRLQFVDIPVSLKLKTKEIGYMRYYGSFGFLTGFTVKANEDRTFDDPKYQDKEKSSNMSDFGFINFGLLLGAGLEYNIAGNTAITVGLQFHNSFVDVWKVESATMNSDYISLNLGIFF